MLMNLPKHYSFFVKLNPESIEYTGNKNELTEYSVDKIRFCSQGNGTKLIFEVRYFASVYFFWQNTFFEVILSRPLMSSILTIYIPTLLLLVIRYEGTIKLKFSLIWQNCHRLKLELCSLFAQVFAEEFPDLVVQVNLTVLLVLASL